MTCSQTKSSCSLFDCLKKDCFIIRVSSAHHRGGPKIFTMGVCFVFGCHLHVWCAGVHVGLTTSVVYIQRHNDKAKLSTSDFSWTKKACEIDKEQPKLGNSIWGKLNESLFNLCEVVSTAHSLTTSVPSPEPLATINYIKNLKKSKRFYSFVLHYKLVRTNSFFRIFCYFKTLFLCLARTHTVLILHSLEKRLMTHPPTWKHFPSHVAGLLFI